MSLEDRIQIKLYNEFYEKNKELFKRDPLQYWRQCRVYVQENLQRIKYGVRQKVA